MNNDADAAAQALRAQIDHALLNKLTTLVGNDARGDEFALVDQLKNDPESGWPAESVLHDETRLKLVERTGLAKGGRHPEIDRIVELAVGAVGVPFAAVNVITDSAQVIAGVCTPVGPVDTGEPWPLTHSMCVYPVITRNPLIIDDVLDHPLFESHPMAGRGQMSAYAAIPIMSEGQAIGALCVWDPEPRHWTGGQIEILTDMSEIVRHELFGGDAAES